MLRLVRKVWRRKREYGRVNGDDNDKYSQLQRLPCQGQRRWHDAERQGKGKRPNSRRRQIGGKPREAARATVRAQAGKTRTCHADVGQWELVGKRCWL